MRIEPNLSTTSFSDVPNSSVLIARMGPRKIIQGVKAFHSEDNGAEASYFVTLGPFFDEHGARPVVYDPADLDTALMFDATPSTRLSYSLRPGDIAVKAFDQAAEEPNAGELLFALGRTLLTVANFGRAGQGQVAYLNLENGELSGLPDEPTFFSLSHWCLETLGAGGDVTNAEEFSTAD